METMWSFIPSRSVAAHPAVPSLFRESRKTMKDDHQMIISFLPDQQHDRQHARCSALGTPDNTQIYEDSRVRLATTVPSVG